MNSTRRLTLRASVYLLEHRREHGQALVAGQVALAEEPVLHVHDHQKLATAVTSSKLGQLVDSG